MTEPKTNVTVSDVLQQASDGFKTPDLDWFWDKSKRVCDLEGGGMVTVERDGDGVCLSAPHGDAGAFVHVHIPKSLLARLAVHWMDTQGIQYSVGRVADAKEGAPDASGSMG